jgi:hypothetical protein
MRYCTVQSLEVETYVPEEHSASVFKLTGLNPGECLSDLVATMGLLYG